MSAYVTLRIQISKYCLDHPPVVEILLNAGADVNAADDEGNSPLIRAVVHGTSILDLSPLN